MLEANTKELNQKLEIYDLLAQIEDPELYQLARNTIFECMEDLKSYSEGILPINSQAHLTSRYSRCENNVKATYWATDINDLYDMEDDFAGRSYYDLNLEALERGIEIKRVFILDKDEVLDKQGKFQDEKALRIILRQKKDGINVHLGWKQGFEGIHHDPELYQDFAIFDDKEVIMQLYGGANTQQGTVIMKKQQKIEKYSIIFQKLWALSRPIDEILNEHPPMNQSPN